MPPCVGRYTRWLLLIGSRVSLFYSTFDSLRGVMVRETRQDGLAFNGDEFRNAGLDGTFPHWLGFRLPALVL